MPYAQALGAERITQVETYSLTENQLSDLETNLPDWLEQFTEETYHCIIFTQGIEHIYHLQSLVQKLHRLLKPGGVLLVAMPGLGHVSQAARHAPGYWAFTDKLAHKLFADVFDTVHVMSQAYGNVLAATTLLHELPIDELTTAERDFQDAHYPLLVAVRARKV